MQNKRQVKKWMWMAAEISNLMTLMVDKYQATNPLTVQPNIDILYILFFAFISFSGYVVILLYLQLKLRCPIYKGIPFTFEEGYSLQFCLMYINDNGTPDE